MASLVLSNWAQNADTQVDLRCWYSHISILMLWVFLPSKTQKVVIVLFWRRCDAMTSQQCQNDIITTLVLTGYIIMYCSFVAGAELIADDRTDNRGMYIIITYCIYTKYWDTSTPYHSPNITKVHFNHALMCPNLLNKCHTVDHDQTPRSVVDMSCSDLSVQIRDGEWLGVAKVSCILRQQSVQLILPYIWARPAILVAGKGRGGMFLFLLFLPFYSCSSFFPVPQNACQFNK